MTDSLALDKQKVGRRQKTLKGTPNWKTVIVSYIILNHSLKNGKMHTITEGNTEIQHVETKY